MLSRLRSPYTHTIWARSSCSLSIYWSSSAARGGNTYPNWPWRICLHWWFLDPGLCWSFRDSLVSLDGATG